MATRILEMASEKVSFSTKIPMLMKATADNDTPTPGYLYQEIAKITMESYSYSNLLLDFLSDRLKKSSPHVKYKALKIMTYVSANGQSEFRSALRHKNQQIRDATSFSGPMDALQGDALNQKVRKAATELIELLFNIENPESSHQSFIMSGPSGQKMEGFGNTPTNAVSKSGGFMDKVKELGSHIPSFGGYLKTGSSEDFNTHEADVGDGQFVSFGEVSSTSSSFGASSRVEFVNYSENKWSPHKEGFRQKVVEYESSHFTKDDEKPEYNQDDEDEKQDDDDDDDEDDDDYGTVENQLVNKITEEGGIRVVPSKESLEQFTQRCSTLDLVKILKLLNTRMEDPSTDVQMKCLFALEHLLRSNIPNIAIKVLECINLQQLIESDSSKIRSKANKVLYTAKSKKGSSETSVRLKEKEERSIAVTSSQPANVHLFTEDHDQKLDSSLDLLGTGSLDVCHVEQNQSDLFHGLLIHDTHQNTHVKSREETKQSVNYDLSDLHPKSRGKSNQSSTIDDLSGLDLLGNSCDKTNLRRTASDREVSLVTFDPLDMGFDNSKEGSSKKSNSLYDILTLNVSSSSSLSSPQEPSSSLLIQPSPSSSSSSPSSSTLHLQSTSTTHQSPIGCQPKNSGSEDPSSFLTNLNDVDVKTSIGQKLRGQKMGQGFVTSSSDNQFGLEALGNLSCLTGLPSQTGKSSLSGQSVGQPTRQMGVSGQPGMKCEGTGLRGQSSYTGQSGFTGISGIHGNVVSTSSTRFTPQIRPNPNHTIPLNLAKPTNQKTDFDFLSKSKRESAFSFVQDEMKASKK